MVQIRGIEFQAEPAFALLLAFELLILPLQWFLAWILAAALHEAGHILAAWLCGYKISAIHLGMRGAVIHTEQMQDVHGLICSAAGPLSCLVILPFCSLFPRIAVCGAVQAIYNMLPVEPLDGANVMRRILALCRPMQDNTRLYRILERGALAVILMLCCSVAHGLSLGILPVCFGVFLVSNNLIRKFSCKDRLHRVQ